MITRNWRLTEYRGLSTDTKPKKASNGTVFVEMDTQKVFFYDAENKRWIAPFDGTVEEIPEETPEQTATMYSYNGTVLPKLPAWDKEKYPYAVIVARYYFVASSSPITWDSEKQLPVSTTPFLMSTVITSAYNIEWGEIEEQESDSALYLGLTWSNHNVLDENESVYLEGSEPKPIYLPFVLYDGEVITEELSSERAYKRIFVSYGFKKDDVLRITLNGEITEYTAMVDENDDAIIGNSGLNVYGNGVDDGGNFLLVYPNGVQTRWLFDFYTKSVGTYNLKIELIGVK